MKKKLVTKTVLQFTNKAIIIKVVLLLIIILSSLSSIYAAGNEFRVLASKGDIFVQKGGKGKWEKIYTGSTISAKDNIKLTKGAYLGLVHSQGRTLELKKVGVYSAFKLSKDVLTMNSSVSKKLVNLIASEVSESMSILDKNNAENNMTQSGAVERSFENNIIPKKDSNGATVLNNKLNLESPIKTALMNPEATFSWFKLPGDINYEFLLCDRFDKPEFSKTIKDTSITINTKDLGLEEGAYYFWKVTAKTTPVKKSDEACFIILHEKESTAIKDTLKLLNKELGYEATAASMMILGLFYERHELINDAEASYREAVRLAPGVEDYHKLYSNFRKRHYE